MSNKQKLTNYGRITNKAMKITNINGKKLNRTDNFVFFTLIVKQGDTAEARIANNVLATISNLDIRSIQRSVKKLNKLGLITIIKESIYSVNPEYLYKENEGFGSVEFRFLESDLSIYAKLLYIVNTVASGKDDYNWYSREKLMKFITIGKDKYTLAMKELEQANIIGQSINYRKDDIGNLLRTVNEKISFPAHRHILTYNRLEKSKLEQRDKRRKQHATIGGKSERQKKDSLTLTNTINHNHKPYTAGSSKNGLRVWEYYPEFFMKGFNTDLLNEYNIAEVSKVVTLFDGIKTATGNDNWTISNEDFIKLKDHVLEFQDYNYNDIIVDDFIDFIKNELIPAGRKGKSLSYWLSDCIKSAYIGNLNAMLCNLEFCLDA